MRTAILVNTAVVKPIMSDTNIDYLTLKTLARRLSVAPRTLRGWMRDPVDPLPGYKVKGTLLFSWSEIEQWLEKFRVKAVDMDAMADELSTGFTKGKNNEPR